MSKKKKGGVLHRLRAKTQSHTIHLTHEEDWDTEVPNVKLSRVFAVVLLLHVVAVGGILAFQFFGGEGGGDTAAVDQPAGAMAADAPANSDRTGTASLTGGLPAPRKIGDPDTVGLRHYRVQSGDSMLSIARRFSVSVEELERLNGFDSGMQLHTNFILYLPSRTIEPVSESEAAAIVAGVPAAPEITAPPVVLRPELTSADQPSPAIVPAAAVEQTAARPESLAVRSPSPAPAPAPAVVAPTPQPASETGKKVSGTVEIYTVNPGDTAFAIGRRYGISPEDLLRINGIDDPRLLRAGQKLKVPLP